MVDPHRLEAVAFAQRPWLSPESDLGIEGETLFNPFCWERDSVSGQQDLAVFAGGDIRALPRTGKVCATDVIRWIAFLESQPLAQILVDL